MILTKLKKTFRNIRDKNKVNKSKNQNSGKNLKLQKRFQK